MAKNKDSQLIMLEHSKAKMELFGRYLSIYLNVIKRVSFIDKIYLFDLFAGEGKYLNDEKGSAITIMESIKNHYYANGESSKNIDVWFNDAGKSEIEPELLKIERVERFVNEIYKPNNVNVKFTKKEYSEVIGEVINQLQKIRDSERALLFIDPWGYKNVKPTQLKQILKNGKTEVILFLPIYFMYRFVGKALTDETFAGGKPLEEFLTELFSGKIPDIKNQINFINDVKEQFKKYLGLKYVDTFTIERETNQFFSLFFFTNNKTGFYKMLDAKWDLDEESGRGFKIVNPNQSLMFDEITSVDYSSMMKDFLKSKQVITNQDLFDFGLDSGFLPKHTKKVLDELKHKNLIEVISLDKEDARSYYIDDNHKRKVQIKLK